MDVGLCFAKKSRASYGEFVYYHKDDVRAFFVKRNLERLAWKAALIIAAIDEGLLTPWGLREDIFVDDEL